MEQNLLGLTHQELQNFLVEMGEKKFRADQIFYELHAGKRVADASNISNELKEKLKQFDFAPLEICKTQISSDGTQKFLYRLCDGNLVEGVLMTYKFGHTLCVSSQVGCRMGCKFCASGLDGLVRNLTVAEMVAQVVAVNNLLGGDVKNRQISNIVLMGSGEPLDNFDNVLKFVDILTNKHGLYFSERNISLSTCGLADKIKILAQSGHQIHLCPSLHASNDEVRQSIMPIARAHKMADVLDACKFYANQTNRRILIEYVLINGVNSSVEQAKELAKKLAGINCMVNLIPLNEVKENNFKKCNSAQTNAFAEVLKNYGISVTTRRSLGDDIDGACGQLRRRFANDQKN